MKLNHTPPNILADVAAFIAIGQPEIKGVPFKTPSAATINLAIKLIEEEVVTELIANLKALVEKGYSIERMAVIMDDIVDSIYVLTWAAVAFDLPINAHWHEVQIANMAKFPNGERIVNEHGKVQKPEGWTPPNHFAVLYEYWHAKYLVSEPNIIANREYIHENAGPKGS